MSVNHTNFEEPYESRRLLAGTSVSHATKWRTSTMICLCLSVVPIAIFVLVAALIFVGLASGNAPKDIACRNDVDCFNNATVAQMRCIDGQCFSQAHLPCGSSHNDEFCWPYACNTTGSLCSTRCMSHEDCTSDAICDGAINGHCVSRISGGCNATMPCQSTDDQCVNGACTLCDFNDCNTTRTPSIMLRNRSSYLIDVEYKFCFWWLAAWFQWQCCQESQWNTQSLLPNQDDTIDSRCPITAPCYVKQIRFIVGDGKQFNSHAFALYDTATGKQLKYGDQDRFDSFRPCIWKSMLGSDKALDITIKDE